MTPQTVQAMIWPIAVLIMVLVFLVLFRASISVFISRLANVSVKAPGVQITGQAIEFATMAGAAASQAPADAGSEGTQGPAAVNRMKAIAELTTRIVTPNTIGRLSNATVLWVDDRPQNNVYERSALEALGIRFTLSLSTDDALNQLSAKKFDVIISDMGRPPDPQAGYTLLDQIRKRGDRTPYFIYAGSNLQEHKDMAIARGAQGSTNRPQELFQYVVSAIQGAA